MVRFSKHGTRFSVGWSWFAKIGGLIVSVIAISWWLLGICGVILITNTHIIPLHPLSETHGLPGVSGSLIQSGPMAIFFYLWSTALKSNIEPETEWSQPHATLAAHWWDRKMTQSTAVDAQSTVGSWKIDRKRLNAKRTIVEIRTEKSNKFI